jgi:hypothetical protein
LPALAVPAFASTEPDPIFAAIEAHRRACADLTTECHSAAENGIATIAGVTALLAYYVEVEAKNAQPAPMVLCRLRSKVCKRRQSISKTSGTKITPAYSSKHLEL